MGISQRKQLEQLEKDEKKRAKYVDKFHVDDNGKHTKIKTKRFIGKKAPIYSAIPETFRNAYQGAMPKGDLSKKRRKK